MNSKNGFWITALALLLCVVVPTSVMAGEKEDNRLGWFGQIHAKMMAKNYDLTQDQAASLLMILDDSKAAKKANQDKLKSIYEELGTLVEEGAEDMAIIDTLNRIKESKMAEQRINASTDDQILTLLGAQKAGKYALSKRGMFDRFKGKLKKSKQSMSDDDPSTWPEVKRQKSGNGGYF
ncbi:MAG: hypothetical protein JKX97_02710 [Candidatus Lindowbacteria bacterium]|nr:hypothetical protein [Candidatus Lindowbacteria bacterium]